MHTVMLEPFVSFRRKFLPALERKGNAGGSRELFVIQLQFGSEMEVLQYGQKSSLQR